MKVLILVLALASHAISTPKPTNLFYEHFEDFLRLIINECGEDLELLLQQYLKYQEFSKSIDFMQTDSFKAIVCDIESLPEFKAVVHYLEEDNIDIVYFIDIVNQLLGTFYLNRDVQEQTSGKNMTSYMIDGISLFPKDKLIALYDSKMDNSKEFKATIERFRSRHWAKTLSAFWTHKTSKKHRHTLANNGDTGRRMEPQNIDGTTTSQEILQDVSCDVVVP